MTTSLSPDTRVLLLVEDNPGDAQLVQELLGESPQENFQIVHVPRVADAVDVLESTKVDVIVLDLTLPDCSGVQTVKAVRETAKQVPMVVLTGTDDERVAMACIDAGAQDYLAKSEVQPRNLKRAIGYAITRVRERQVGELQEVLLRYKSMSSATQATSVTAALAGSGAVALRSPETFEAIVQAYFALLNPYIAHVSDKVEAPHAAKEAIVTNLGDAGGGPRDLLDIHIEALNRAMALQDDARTRYIVFEARLLALEMMGLLVDYYRVGHRRRFL